LHKIVSLELFARPRNDPVIWRSSKSVGVPVFIVNNCSHKGLRKKLLAKKKKRRVTRCERAGLGFGGHYSYLVLRIVYCAKQALFSYGGLRSPIIGGGCAFDAKNRVFFGWSKFVNAYVKRDKKNFGFLDFWFYLPAHLIERSFRPTAVLHSRRPMLDVQQYYCAQPRGLWGCCRRPRRGNIQ